MNLRPLSLRLLTASASAAALFATTQAQAGPIDANPPLPNVLLLVDTSGSMEYQTGTNTFPACNPTSSAGNGKSRWVDLLEVLTGTIVDYRCEKVDRTLSDFNTEYSVAGQSPPDYRYSNPYHRPLSGKSTDGVATSVVCGPTAGTYTTSNVFDYMPLKYRRPGAAYVSTKTCSWPPGDAQYDDGLLDTFENLVRFGLMTFDTEPREGRGYSSGSPSVGTTLLKDGIDSTWSYWSSSSYAMGLPADCGASASPLEVGARNAAAPPWEGRMVGFPYEGLLAGQNNRRIQEVLLGTRPYGATPIAGMLADALYYLTGDMTRHPQDPAVPAAYFGPKGDGFVTGGCRKNYAILLTDGEPNLDLRPYCVSSTGSETGCPYDRPEQIAASLKAHGVDLFVVGFALTTPVVGSTTYDCTTLDPAGSTCAAPPSPEVRACCTMHKLAYEGGTSRAHFANDVGALRATLSNIIASIATSTTSRTLPVFATGALGGGAGAKGFQFYSAFRPRVGLWEGTLERQRFVCELNPVTHEYEPVAKDITPSEGDDFAANLATMAPARKIFSVLGRNASGTAETPSFSVRPELTSNPDGVGDSTAVVYGGSAVDFVGTTTAAAMNVSTASSGCSDAGSPAGCKTRILNWLVGNSNGTGYHRCPTPGSASCSLLGDIYHSTPRVVSGQPSEALRDESYNAFSARTRRPTVLYTSTNDGFLHAFKVAPAPGVSETPAKANNELWAFVPPAILPKLQKLYPPTKGQLLDGAPVVKDVVATKLTGVDPIGRARYSYERQLTQSREATGSWRSVLVQSFGTLDSAGYFALDVTEPELPASGLNDSKGPRFLWQLTTDAAGTPLFGYKGGTPLITTLYFKPTSASAARQVAVAVLPGGQVAGPSLGTSTGCTRSGWSSYSGMSPQPRQKVPCYNGATNERALSLTIVRLDTGEVIRSFRRTTTQLPDLAARGRIKVTPLDSPITGQPVAYPAGTGAIADRVFVGDADGTLWKVDLTSTDPDNWNMSLFFDLYSGEGPYAGQPITYAPVLSVTERGELTLAASSGEQDELSAAPTMVAFATSLTEVTNTSTNKKEAKLNWYTRFTGGERVAGPMTLFNGTLYFSSFTPPSSSGAAACSSGSSRVWGVDYLLPKTSGVPADGGKERFPAQTTPSIVYTQYIDSTNSLIAGATIFGVGVTQMPSCAEETTYDDPYMGYGTSTAYSNVNSGNFQLVMQAGATGGSKVTGGSTNLVKISLPPPPSTSRLSSWAAILE